MTDQPDVLVVGAGPTGLTLALQARACGATVRVLERREQAWRPSRALLVHARTLEVLRPLGVVDAVLARAETAPGVRLHVGARTVSVRLDASGMADTAFPHLTLARQADLEAVLAAGLAERGVEVERGVTVTGLEQHPDGVRVAVRTPAGAGEARGRYVVGCDGAASVVRSAAGVRWRGFAYPTEVVLADVELDGPLSPDGLHVAVGRAGLVFLFRCGELASWRLLVTRPSRGPSPVDSVPGELGPPVAREELDELLAGAAMGARCSRVAWSSRIHMAHRLADSYRMGRVLLAGDAAHVHSPAGGQGMNTGIQDAANLGWKLAYAARGDASPALLDSYERERRPVARQVGAWTDLIFWAESARSPVASFVRGALAPLGAPLLPFAVRLRWLVAEAVRVLGQLRVDYRGSPLSVQHARHARPRAGDRVPDAMVSVAGRRVRLGELTAVPGVHVLLREQRARGAERHGGTAVGPRYLAEDTGLWYPDHPDIHVHRLDGWTGPTLTVVRPDGYAGLCSDVVDADEIATWLSLVGLGADRRDGF